MFISFSFNGQIVNIPDANFKNALLHTNCADFDGDFITDGDVDANNDMEIQNSEVLAVLGLYVYSQNITTLEGINSFTNLIILKFEGNQVSTVNISNLSQLQGLYCDNNLLSEINLCGTAVTSLWTNNNLLLHYISIKNNVISNAFLNRSISNFPPPLPQLWFNNCPLLETVCYDDGELSAILYGVNFSSNPQTFNLVTDCVLDCPFLATHQIETYTKFEIVQNPVGKVLQISLNGDISIQTISIYNTVGQLMKSISENSKIIDVSELKTGTYFIEVISNQGKTTKKFMKL